MTSNHGHESAKQTRSFNEEEFWTVFYNDLETAKGHVVIQSAFITMRRLKLMADRLKSLTRRKVAICIFLQEPQDYANRAGNNHQDLETDIKSEEFKCAIRLLQKIGCHVNLREKVHHKLAAIDNEILWEGSLNILSFNSTFEHMRRWQNPEETDSITRKYGLLSCKQCAEQRRSFGIVGSIDGLIVIGRAIVAHREKKSISQRRLGRLCDMVPARLKQIESGKNYTVSNLLKVTEKLGLEILLIPSLYVPTITNQLREANEAAPLCTPISSIRESVEA